MRATTTGRLIVATIGVFVLSQPAEVSAIQAGINIDVHQDIPPISVPPNDFHVAGRIESGEPGQGWADPPILLQHVDDLFTHFTHSIQPDPNDPNENWYNFVADWSAPAGTVGIPFCTELHIGLLFDVNCHNVVIDLVGWWTLDGEPIHVGVNDGFIPIPGFDVRDRTPAQFIRIQNGNADGAIGPGEIEMAVVQMDLLSVASEEELGLLLGPEPFRELRKDGMQQFLRWVRVFQGPEPISEQNPVPLPPDSFFDVFLAGTELIHPETPVPVPPGGFLLAREMILFRDNSGQWDFRWVWEMHEAHQADLGDAPDSSNSWGIGMSAYPFIVSALYPTVYRAGSPPYGPIHWRPREAAFLGEWVTLEDEADLMPDEDPTTNIIPPTDLADLDRSDDGVVGMPLALPHCTPTTFDFVVTTVNPVDPMYINVFFDWNRNGTWDDVEDCPFGVADEWAVRNMVLAGLLPHVVYTFTTPPFLPWHPTELPHAQQIWMRITLSEKPRDPAGGLESGGGDGPPDGYRFGETEDYIFFPQVPEPVPKWIQLPHGAGEGFDAASDLWLHDVPPPKWVQLPEPRLPGLHAHDRLGPFGGLEWTTLADDWVCDGGDVLKFNWWGNYELDLFGMERRGSGIRNFHLSIHLCAGGFPWCLPMDLAIWGMDVPFGLTGETWTGLLNSEGCRIYQYAFDLPIPFQQMLGEHYWFDIEAHSVDPGVPAIWRWQEARRGPAPPLGLAPAAERRTVDFPGPWHSIVWSGDPERYSDLAFSVTGVLDTPPEEVNKVVADDFISDGRPIETVRWWGSYLDDRYAPGAGTDPFHVMDGWIIGFHHLDPTATATPCPPDLLAGSPHPTALGLYFVPVEAVEIRSTGYEDCFAHEVFEYIVDLRHCCLICAEPDPRSGHVPARSAAFLEEYRFGYWLDVQAVAGVVWIVDPSGSTPDCVPRFTGHLPSDFPGSDGHFWGWHTSRHLRLNEACTGQIVLFMAAPDYCWDYGGWDKQPWLCPEVPVPLRVNMGFELLTTLPGPACPHADVNMDGVADGFDIAVIRNGANWLKTADVAAEPRADVNGDFIIDGFDIAVIRSGTCWLH